MNRCLLALPLAAAVVAAPAAAAPVLRYGATLNTSHVTPPPKGVKAGASGSFVATLNGTRLIWTLSYSSLSGKATAAHLHLGARGKNGPILVPLCGPQPEFSCTGRNKGISILSKKQIAAMQAGGVYVNVHTARNPGGEIRGQVGAAG